MYIQAGRAEQSIIVVRLTKNMRIERLRDNELRINYLQDGNTDTLPLSVQANFIYLIYSVQIRSLKLWNFFTYVPYLITELL